MKVLLRHAHSGMYLSLAGTWVLDVSEAFDFGGPEPAIKYSHENALEDLEIVLRYDNPPSEHALKVPQLKP